MTAKAKNSGYTPTIGIECHVQLNTRTKLFSAVDNNARTAQPNTLISHIDLGMPGALPVLNEAAVQAAMKVAFAFNTTPQKYSYFERKHYFYPDLPKGYQITQLAHPIIVGGHVDIEVDGQTKKIRINRVQLEEDAGKSTHPSGKDYSLVDLNRAGTPLLEIVSEADMHSSAEAKAYARELYLLIRYSRVSDADLYHGNMRFDVNVSVSKDDSLGTRTETKNLNSFRSVAAAVDYEIDRQIDELEAGRPIIQETRGWEDATQKTFSQRSKEEAHDYRYFPEPDIPPVELTQKAIDQVKDKMPLLPAFYRDLFKDLGLEAAAVETLIFSPASADFIRQIKESAGKDHAKRVANWIINVVGTPVEDVADDAELAVSTEAAVTLSKMVAENKLNSTAGKEVWLELVSRGGDPLKIAEDKNLLQVSDESTINKIVDKVLAENPKAAEDLRAGQMKAAGFLVGQVMKLSSGQANPGVAMKLIKQQLGL